MQCCVTSYISRIDHRSQVTQIIKHRVIARPFHRAISPEYFVVNKTIQPPLKRRCHVTLTYVHRLWPVTYVQVMALLELMIAAMMLMIK